MKPAAVAKAESNPVHLGNTPVVEKPVEPAPELKSDWGLSGNEEAELEAALQGSSFDDLMAKTDDTTEELEADSRIKGVVSRIAGDNVFVSLKGRLEGVVSLRQFKEPPAEGAMIEVVVKGENQEDGLYELTIPGAAVTAEDWDSIQQGDVVEAKVTGTNTGGLEVSVNGLRGFIPASQIDRVRVESFGDYVNQKLECLVQELNPKRKKLVLSRRAILDRVAEEKRKELMGELQAGQILEGLVTRLADFGAFVDVGGVEGLIHISKMSWNRIKHPSEVLSEGEKVKVKVEKVDPATGKISLSHRDTIEHPWDGLEERFPVNSIAKGKVTRIAQFGAFVELSPGVEGLVHISELAHHRVFAVKNVVQVGDEIEVKVLAIERDKQKMSLSLKATQAAPERKSNKDEKADEDLPAREMAVAKRGGPLQGGRGRNSGGEQFGLKL
ncbi:MAG: S1 RNA-binding domain-containing protein [Pirellulaceae bacterium]